MPTSDCRGSFRGYGRHQESGRSRQLMTEIDSAGPTVESEIHGHLLEARLTDSGAVGRFIILELPNPCFGAHPLTLLARHRPH
jgi:hypothetical protein